MQSALYALMRVILFRDKKNSKLQVRLCYFEMTLLPPSQIIIIKNSKVHLRLG